MCKEKKAPLVSEPSSQHLILLDVSPSCRGGAHAGSNACGPGGC
jgi:hypothetical protein